MALKLQVWRKSQQITMSDVTILFSSPHSCQFNLATAQTAWALLPSEHSMPVNAHMARSNIGGFNSNVFADPLIEPSLPTSHASSHTPINSTLNPVQAIQPLTTAHPSSYGKLFSTKSSFTELGLIDLPNSITYGRASQQYVPLLRTCLHLFP